MTDEKLLGGLCFVPSGPWKADHIPIYNPTDLAKKVRVLIADPAGQIAAHDVFVSGRAVTTFSAPYGYALVDEFPG